VTGLFFPDFSRRATEPELMDDPQVRYEEIAAALSDLRRINKSLRVTSALTNHLFAMIRQWGMKSVSILDVGAGSADIPAAIVQWARRSRIGVKIVALDLSQTVLRIARTQAANYPEISFVQGDALQLPFERNCFDFAIATEFLHHLETAAAAVFLRRLREIVRVAFIINDLRRHPISYYGFILLSQIFFRSRLVRNDGPVSILRGFTAQDFDQIKQESGLNHLSLYSRFPYRIIVVGKK
jgi:2-polyprenyl-3-methyl-5-hydroxy-6-metoxy-1,4-benzoquinol methylase